MNDKARIHLSLEFGDAILPIEINDQGHAVVALKPISDLFSLDWENQRKRVSDGYLARRLGTCTVFFQGAGMRREMTAIRLDRVASYLQTLNPDMIRSRGGEDAATYLEARHAEWDDLLFCYEQRFGIFSKSGRREIAKQPGVRDLLAILRDIEKTKSPSRLTLLNSLAEKIASSFGVAYPKEIKTTT